KWRAEEAKRLDRERLRSSYVAGLPAYLSATPEEIGKLNAALEHRAAIEAANQTVDRSYDPQALQLWHDLDRRQDSVDTPLEDAEATGLTHARGMEELAAIRQQGEDAFTPQQRFNRRVLAIWASNVAMADRMIRGGMLLAAYRSAEREGMDAINRVWDRDKL